MVMRSVTPCSEKKFAISLTALDWRWDHARHLPAQRCAELRNVSAHRGPHCWITHDAFLEVRPPGLELRLDQRDEPRGPACQAIKLGQDPLERDEAHIDGDEIRRLDK